MTVVRKANGDIELSQQSLIRETLEAEKMLDASPVPTPLTTDVLRKRDPAEPQADAKRLKRIVGKLLYCTLTRPDLMFAVHRLSKFASDPAERHLIAAKRVLRYLKGTQQYVLRYSKTNSVDSNPTLSSFSDATWASDLDDRSSVTGFVILLGGNPIFWKTKQQSVTALSSAESETVAASEATRSIVGLKNLLNELGFDQHAPTVLNIDNTAVIQNAVSGRISSALRHVATRERFVNEASVNGDISLRYVASRDNVADVLTKSLPKEPFQRARLLLNVYPP
jgi:hypothetical protein